MNKNWSDNEIVSIAREMLEGDFDLLIGCRAIAGLYSNASEPEDDIFMLFRAVASEIDKWPIGVARDLCDPEYLKRVDKDVSAYLSDTTECIRQACEKVIEYYSTADSVEPELLA